MAFHRNICSRHSVTRKRESYKLNKILNVSSFTMNHIDPHAEAVMSEEGASNIVLLN